MIDGPYNVLRVQAENALLSPSLRSHTEPRQEMDRVQGLESLSKFASADLAQLSLKLRGSGPHQTPMMHKQVPQTPFAEWQ